MDWTLLKISQTRQGKALLSWNVYCNNLAVKFYSDHFDDVMCLAIVSI